ncbi:ATP-NAD kinase-like domain-containing protein [Lasiosphaeris hirsuta]|uniref:ATP-NAD kinase-like domain-containing protein n=1 Tax=Lasiosphaeris hirsuta TaxID=260670 RepID=A0AA40AFS0_9PEZI|nr:ATP-NAD kinase-like domain-containing protein [Lasiosphaeris hirsuta]
MDVHMPPNAGDTQAPAQPPATPPAVVVHHANAVNYSNGELVWTARDSAAEESARRVRREEIVFILKHASSRGYFVYSLAEGSGRTANNGNVGDSDGDTPPFELSVLSALQLPEGLLAEFLIDEIPGHLRSDGLQSWLHVIVSTRSGIGQAPSFFDGVLHPLLEALGLAPLGLGLADPAGESWSRSESGSEEGGTARYHYRYQLTVTQSSNTIRDFARGLAEGADGKANRRQPGENGAVVVTPSRTVVLLSGDGGIIDLLNGLDKPATTHFTPPTIAVLPLGTGNALFHSLHKPPHYTAAAAGDTTAGAAPSTLVLGLRTLFRGVSAPLPTFKATFSPRSRLISFPEPVLNDGPPAPPASNSTTPNPEPEPTHISHLLGAIVASYGFHASLVWESDTPAYRVHGDKRFGMAAAELLKLSHAYDAAVETRARGSAKWAKVRTRGGRFNYVLATMVSNLEKTFTISPASRPLDGQLRLVSFGGVGGEKTMEIMMAAYRGGEHVGMRWGEGEEEDGVGYDEVEEVRVTIDEEDPRWRKVCIDGTIVEVEKGGWMTVGRADEERLKVLVDRSVL